MGAAAGAKEAFKEQGECQNRLLPLAAESPLILLA